MSKDIELTDRKLEGKIVAGIDTHADTHWLCVLNKRHRVALLREFLSTPDGFEALCAAVGIEGTCSYGAGLTDALMVRGFKVLEVLNKKKDQRRRHGEGKDDEIDAERAGHTVVAYDHHQDRIDAIVAAGGVDAKSGREVGEQSDGVIMMMQNSPNVESALFDEDGVFEGLSEGKAVIDMSSINPIKSREFAARLAKKGVDFLDAPVSGGEPKAIDGTIAVMVGGEQDVFDKYEPLLQTMASTVTLVGGVDPSRVYQAIRSGLAGSVVMDQKSQKIFDGNFEPGFRIELHIKDLQNALDTSHGVNVSTPFTSLAMEIMQSLKAHGHEKDDHSGIAEWYEMVNDFKLQD